MPRHRLVAAVSALAIVALMMSACARRGEAEPPKDDWKPLGSFYPELASAFAEPEAGEEPQVSYIYEGYAPYTVELDADQAARALELLGVVEVGPLSDTRWEDYGDAFIVTLADGTTHRLAFEGHSVVVDAANPQAAYEVRNAEGLWDFTSELVGEDW